MTGMPTEYDGVAEISSNTHHCPRRGLMRVSYAKYSVLERVGYISRLDMFMGIHQAHTAYEDYQSALNLRSMFRISCSLLCMNCTSSMTLA